MFIYIGYWTLNIYYYYYNYTIGKQQVKKVISCFNGLHVREDVSIIKESAHICINMKTVRCASTMTLFITKHI